MVSRKAENDEKLDEKSTNISSSPISQFLFIFSLCRTFNLSLAIFLSFLFSFYFILFFAAVVVVWNQQQPNSNWSIQMQIQVGVKFFLMYK